MTAFESVVALLPEARSVVDAHLNRTELRELGWLHSFVGRPTYAKLETQQVTGSFKVRGALVALSRLAPGTHVVSPSAGNHGLAIAWVAARLGLSADIVLPQNASPLKRERILALGAGVIEAGSSVDDAADEAHRLAEQASDRHYVSPFNDVAIAAGQATAFVEMLEACPEIQSLVVSVGGGGLLAGAIAARKYLGRTVHIVGCEPNQFPSMMKAVQAGRSVRVNRRPTFADGLALSLEPDSITLDIVREAPDLDLCTVTEEEIAAACVAIFNRESLLVEGAGATGVSALLQTTLELPDGPVGTILCGGNIHHSTFWRMAAFPFTDPRLVAVADTLGRTVEAEPLRRQRLNGGFATPDAEHDNADEAGLPEDVVAAIGRYTAKTAEMLEDFAGFARDSDLPLDESLFDLVSEVNDRVDAQVRVRREDNLQVREQRVRVLSQLAVAARLAFEWRSPAYDHAAALAEFDLGALDSPAINYARYDQPGVPELERQLAELLRISPETHGVLMTSSGMAAFALAVETVFAAGRVRSALTAPYLYFEGAEMLSYWCRDQMMVAASYDAGELAEQARAMRADVVFADPLANHPDQRMIDIERLARLLADQDPTPWLLIDASMLPTVTARAVTEALPEQAIYFESCSKYLQFGLDVAMAGMVVVPRSLEPLARRVRRNLGLGIDRYGAELFPRYRPEWLERRLAAMERSARWVAADLDRILPRDFFEVTFPGLPSHPDHELARRLGRTGSSVTLAPIGLPLGRDQLEPLVDAALAEARRRKLPLVKGLSFGFSTSRLSAAAAMAEGAPPFLRLAVGPTDRESATELADVTRLAIEKITASWSPGEPHGAR